MCMWWPQNNFSCPNLHVLEIHSAVQILLQFTTGRDEHKSEPVPCPSPVLLQSLTKYWWNKGPNFMTVFFRTGILQNYSYENTERSPHFRWKFKGAHHLQPWPPARQFFKAWVKLFKGSLALPSVGVKHNCRVLRFFKFLFPELTIIYSS